jgi:hypothetical protein
MRKRHPFFGAGVIPLYAATMTTTRSSRTALFVRSFPLITSCLIIVLMALRPSGVLAGQLVQFGDAFGNAPAQRLLGYLAKPDGAGPFPAVIVMFLKRT